MKLAKRRVSPLNGSRGVLFDFGGTLDSDGGHWLDRFSDLYEALGVQIPQSRIKEVFYLADRVCCEDPQVNDWGLRRLMAHHVRIQFQALGLDSPTMEAEMVDRFCSPMEDCLRRNRDLLRRLAGRYRLGLVSNFYGNVAALCDEAYLSDSFRVILDSVQIGFGKPDPRIFRMALEKLQLPPEQVVFVGDSYERDMIPAAALGLRTIWLKGPKPRIPEGAPPVDGVITELAELEEWLA